MDYFLKGATYLRKFNAPGQVVQRYSCPAEPGLASRSGRKGAEAMKPVNMSFSWAAGRGLPAAGEEAGAGKGRRGWCWASRIGPGGSVRGAERGRSGRSCPWC